MFVVFPNFLPTQTVKLQVINLQKICQANHIVRGGVGSRATMTTELRRLGFLLAASSLPGEKWLASETGRDAQASSSEGYGSLELNFTPLRTKLRAQE
ncbi:hypothetical protein N1851_028417 [Merluccius polli]|uniref:Uncharacterized protein n=1 Tax=Merluccius polli TaxID=89951 RepID=A0AA47NSE9_MERPO|nr:hypothetical protein N1851_028417 [Merluccius polli]